MYVSAADNDYVGVTGTFLGTPSQGVWSTARLDFLVLLGRVCLSNLLADSLPSRARPRWTGLPRRTTWAATSCCATTDVFTGRGRGRSLLRSAHSHRHRCHADLHGAVSGGLLSSATESPAAHLPSTTRPTGNLPRWATCPRGLTAWAQRRRRASQPPVRLRAPR